MRLSSILGIMIQSMNLTECIEKRRSIRKYIKNKNLTESQINSILNVAQLAPSSSNKQDWELLLVDNPIIKKELVEACDNQSFIADCSIFIAGISTAKHKWSEIDIAIALEHIALKAVEMGLGTCWIGAFDKEKVSKILKIPRDKELIICIILGFPDERPLPSPRKSINQLIAWNRY